MMEHEDGTSYRHYVLRALAFVCYATYDYS